MKKIAILGVTGMLGNQVLEEFSKTDYEIVTTTRKELDAQSTTIEDIKKILNGCDYAINCIGLIKAYIHENDLFEIKKSIDINAIFPHKLAEAGQKTGTKIIQIATDCVYDGKNGNYDENSEHNAKDIYGKTKSLGEIHQDNFLNLRCSIIGREKKSYFSLLEWFLNQPKNSQINGFKNHYWNGITTNAFAKICLGIIKNDLWFEETQHIIPADVLSKAEMLKIFAEVFERKDIQITEIDASETINRTLLTLNIKMNETLWQQAGYKNIPTIEKMIREMKNAKMDK